MHSFIPTHYRSLRVLGLSLGLAALFALSGCATMTEGECLTANWFDRGYKDGYQGYPAARVADHRDACAIVGIAPDITEYLEGYDEGVAEYCTPANAIAEGRAGNSYGNVCPARLESEFLFYYRQGMNVHRAQQYVDELNLESRQLQQKLSETKEEDARLALRKELQELDDRLRRARDELADYDRSMPYR